MSRRSRGQARKIQRPLVYLGGGYGKVQESDERIRGEILFRAGLNGRYYSMVCLKTRSKVQKADFALAKPAYGSKPCRLRRRFASPSREIRISKNPHKTDSWSSSSPESTFLALQSTMSSPDYPTLATIKSRDEFFRQVGANNMSSVVEIIDQHKCQDDFRCTHVADPYTLLLP
ncbi:hypothetical protein LCGC14_1579760, partial [marine sediment metagenome]